MKQVLKRYLLIALFAYASYFIMSHHMIFYGKQVHLLNKDSLHLHYTFFSLNQKTPEVVLQIGMLREAGIGDLMVDLGIVSREKLMQVEQQIDTGS